jgi:hypothetical protein
MDGHEDEDDCEGRFMERENLQDLGAHWGHEPLPVGRFVPDRRTGSVDRTVAARRDAEPYVRL